MLWPLEHSRSERTERTERREAEPPSRKMMPVPSIIVRCHPTVSRPRATPRVAAQCSTASQDPLAPSTAQAPAQRKPQHSASPSTAQAPAQRKPTEPPIRRARPHQLIAERCLTVARGFNPWNPRTRAPRRGATFALSPTGIVPCIRSRAASATPQILPGTSSCGDARVVVRCTKSPTAGPIC